MMSILFVLDIDVNDGYFNDDFNGDWHDKKW